jgi:hypothetical protein
VASAWLLTGDGHLAEDLVQTALAKSYAAWTRVGDAGVLRIVHLRLGDEVETGR